MASYVPVVKNGANGAILYVGLVDQANTKLLKSSPTLATGDFKVSIDGGALANLNTLPTVTPAAGRQVKITLSQAEVNGDNITVQCVDAAGAEWCDLLLNIQTATRQLDDHAFPATSGRSMVVDAAGLVDANSVKLGPSGSGTAQTARDIGASVLLSAGAGTGQLDFTSGVVKANLAQILATALTEVAGQLAGGFKKFFNIAAPVSTMDVVARVTLVDTLTTYTGNTLQTGDSFARLGAPAGASVSADILVIDDFVDTEVAAILAAVDTEVAAIKAKTDNLPEGIQKNATLTAFEFYMVLSSDNVSPATGLTITAERSIDGVAFAAMANAAAEVGNGIYKINLAAADTNGDFITFKFTAATASPTLVSFKTES